MYAVGVNDSGEVIGAGLADANGVSKPNLYRGGVLYNLNAITHLQGFTITRVAGINDAGQIASTASTPKRPNCAVLLTPSFHIGQSVMGIPFPGEVPATTRINVRSTPAGAFIGTQPNGVVGVIKAGPAFAPANPAILNDVTTPWWNVTFPSGVSGWVGQIVLGLTAPAQTGFIFKDEKMYDLSQIAPGVADQLR